MSTADTKDRTFQEPERPLGVKRRSWSAVWVAIVALLVGGTAGWVLRGSDEASGVGATPGDVESLIDDWWDALNRGDGSVIDTYTATGYHLYGDKRFERDEIATHLQTGTPEDHKWVTEPVLIVDEGDGRYVVSRGLSNRVGVVWFTSALTLEVVTTSEGVRFAHTAWSFVN